MTRFALDVTNYLDENGQLPADTLCEWLAGLDLKVGASRNEFGQAVTDIIGSRQDIILLLDRYESDKELLAEHLKNIEN